MYWLAKYFHGSVFNVSYVRFVSKFVAKEHTVQPSAHAIISGHPMRVRVTVQLCMHKFPGAGLVIVSSELLP